MTIFPFIKPIFQPAMRVIAAITNTNPVQVTTTVNHLYQTNTIVRIDVPPGFGMTQINQQFAPITVTGDTTFTMPIDTTLYDLFVIPVTYPLDAQQAQAIPFAEDNSILTAAVQNVLPFP